MGERLKKDALESEERAWEITRPAGPSNQYQSVPTGYGQQADKYTESIQVLFNLYNEFGAQSTLISAATYRNNADGSSLQRGVLFSALRKVIEEHYALSIIPVERPSETYKNKQRLWEARLFSINLEDHVQFVEIESADTVDGMRRVIQDIHNQDWLEPEDDVHARWRIKVVNGRHVIFAYDHFIADGLSGFAFHKSLSRALDAANADQKDWVVCPSNLNPPTFWADNFFIKPSIWYLIISTLTLKFMRLLFESWMMFDDAKYNASLGTYADRFKKTGRCQTKIFGLDLTTDEQVPLVQACKRNGVTYSAVLHTLAIGTLAADIYPYSRMGRSSLAASIRPYSRIPQSPDTMVNSVATMVQNFWSLSNYRCAMKAPTKLSARVDASQLPATDLDVELVVSLSKAYTKEFRRVNETYEMYHSSLAWDIIKKDKQDVYKTAFPNLPLFQHNTILLSNLGPFDSRAGRNNEKPIWTVTDIHFSAGATRSNFGPATPVINVASLKDGPCHMNVVLDEGILPDGLVETFLARLKERLLLFARTAQQ